MNDEPKPSPSIEIRSFVKSLKKISGQDADGKFFAEWKQFGRPSSVFVDRNDTIYVADSTSDEKRNPGFKQGIRIGNIKDGKVTAFIPLVDPQLQSAEEVAADDQGNVYGGFTSKRNLKKFVEK